MSQKRSWRAAASAAAAAASACGWISVSGKVPEREAHAVLELSLDPFDRPKRLARIRALVVAVLDEDASGRRTADVIDGFLEGCIVCWPSSGIAPPNAQNRPSAR